MQENIKEFTIVHLDDDVIFIKMVKLYLQDSALPLKFNLKSYLDIPSFKDGIRNGLNPDIFLIDNELGHDSENGITLAKECRRKYPNATIIMCSNHTRADIIYQALREGANDYFSKNLDQSMFVQQLLKIHFFSNLSQKTSRAERSHLNEAREGRVRVVGDTFKTIEKRMPHILNSAVSSIYVEGESGVGKEIVADIIESFLPEGTPFLRVNCSNISHSLLESELFGYKKGSFTGAHTDREGILESATGGWVFLDEISSLSLSAQASLLRALESRQIRRVGDTVNRDVSFKLLSASNEPLSDMVREKKFRNDFFQRLNETTIKIPPLRSRMEEIEEFCFHFCNILSGGPYYPTDAVLEILKCYDWREGNVRELRNTIVAMTPFHIDQVLTPMSLSETFWERFRNGNQSDIKKQSTQGSVNPEAINKFVRVPWDDAMERSYQSYSDILLLELVKRIESEAELRSEKFSLRLAARILKISRETLSVRLRKMKCFQKAE